MSAKLYSNEKNTQILVALLKKHNIKRVIASPGTTNINFVASLQHDSYFQIYSCVDERSAAYMACGMAAETNEPVVLSCTGATASRNYVPGLTEAFYRKLPVLAVTSTQHTGKVGQMIPQVIDRSVIMKDIANFSTTISTVHDNEDYWAAQTAINTALLELRRHGGGPVHINLVTKYDRAFSTAELPDVPVIRRFSQGDALPEILKGKVGVFVGSHTKWSDQLTKFVERFCELYDAVVICDQTSNYHGQYKIMPAIVCSQTLSMSSCNDFDLLIHIGEISGAYYNIRVKSVWRVSPDGNVSDMYQKLQFVFEMTEEQFFSHYLRKDDPVTSNTFYQNWLDEISRLMKKIPELPFSNLWIAKVTLSLIPENSVLHLGILNSLRSWNFFEAPKSLLCYSNTGGFGIDGGMSSMVGAALVGKSKHYFLVLGDLAFFYDINVLGNRHLPSNIRILLINNGCGTEFKNFNHMAATLGDTADQFIAAAGHFGQKSPFLVRNFVENLGFEYLSASDKEEYLKNLSRFVSPNSFDKPLIFEVFTNSKDESEALSLLTKLDFSTNATVKVAAKRILGQKNINRIKELLR